MIESDGAFVGYEAGKYVITATLGNRAAEAVVSLSWRDVRRPATVVGRLARSLFTPKKSGFIPTARSPTSAPAAAATACMPSTSAIRPTRSSPIR